MKILSYRQGEIGLIKVNCAPEGTVAHKIGNNVILGHGKSGNAHVLIGNDIEWLITAVDDINEIAKRGAAAANGKVYINIPKSAKIVHNDPEEPHREINVSPGIYELTIDREMIWWEDEVRRVMD